MSVKILSRVWDESTQEGGVLLVALALADFADDRGCCYPSIPVLAKKSRLSDRQAQRCVHKLIEDGELELVGNPFGGRKSNTYHLIQRDQVTRDILTPDTHDTPGVTPMTPQPCHPCHPRLVKKPLESIDAEWTYGKSENREPSVEPSVEPSLQTQARQEPSPSSENLQIRRDQILLALLAVCGIVCYPAIGSGMWKRLLKAFKEIGSLSPDVTAEEVKRRAENYRKMWPRMSLTIESLAKHWSILDSVPSSSIGQTVPMF